MDSVLSHATSGFLAVAVAQQGSALEAGPSAPGRRELRFQGVLRRFLLRPGNNADRPVCPPVGMDEDGDLRCLHLNHARESGLEEEWNGRPRAFRRGWSDPFRCSCFPVQASGCALNGAEGGGRGGIRTPDTLSGTPVFKTGAINHSATLPYGSLEQMFWQWEEIASEALGSAGGMWLPAP